MLESAKPPGVSNSSNVPSKKLPWNDSTSQLPKLVEYSVAPTIARPL